MKYKTAAIIEVFDNIRLREIKAKGPGDPPSTQAEREALMKSVQQDFSECAIQVDYACFRATHILTNGELTLCSPTVTGCDYSITQARLNREIVVRDDRCYVVHTLPFGT